MLGRELWCIMGCQVVRIRHKTVIVNVVISFTLIIHNLHDNVLDNFLNIALVPISQPSMAGKYRESQYLKTSYQDRGRQSPEIDQRVARAQFCINSVSYNHHLTPN